MAGIDYVHADSATDDPERLGGVAPKPTKRKKSDLDGDKMVRLHGKLIAWYKEERDIQQHNREQMAIDEDYYDGLQWSDDDAFELIQRGQAPLVYNKIKPTINWMLGTERRTRIDGTVLPREENDEEGAEVKSKLLKYLSDINRTPFSRSEAWADCIIAGLGWLEDAISTDPGEELLYSRRESWRFIYYDSKALERDLSDARFIFRFKWVDLDYACALFPQRANVLKSAAVDGNTLGTDDDDLYYLGTRVNTETSGDYQSAFWHRSARTSGSQSEFSSRERVKIIEAWYRVPENCEMCRGGKHDGKLYDAKDPQMVSDVENGYTSVVKHARWAMRCALMTEDFMLYEGPSPYNHDRFPFTPMWCYRRKRDGLPYGVIRDIRDAQDDYNKRASKALFILSSRTVIMDRDAYDDIEEVRAEAARPDAVFAPKRSTRFELPQDKQLAEEHLMLMDRDAMLIRDVGGITEQNLGKDDKGLSGQAIGKLQDQGAIVTAALFDNMRLAIQMQTEIQLSLIEQFYSEEKVIRIVGENKPIEWIPINRYDPATKRFINDITASKADFVVAEQDFRASIRQAMFESLMDLIGKLPPEVGLNMLDMVIDFADVPNKEELVTRIRKLNGQRDPTRKPTPEEQQAMAEAEAKAKAVEQLQIQTAQAQLDKIVSDITKANAVALKEAVTAAYTALQGAQIVATVPSVTPVADAILEGAGYVDKQGQDPNIPAPTGQLPAMTPQPKDGVFIGEGAVPAPQQTDGAQAGIETPTGADNIPPTV